MEWSITITMNASFLLWLLPLSCMGLAPPPPFLSLWTRADAVRHLFWGTTSSILPTRTSHLPSRILPQQSMIGGSNSNSSSNNADIQFSLRFLPVSGCFALRTTLTRVNDDDNGEESSFSYYAIVDTGSPFLTAPTRALPMTLATNYSTTTEQYGESVGGMEWRRADIVTWIVGESSSNSDSNILEVSETLIGIASEQVIQETGGIFVGLVDQDDNHPSFLQQLSLPFRSIVLHFDRQRPSLRLSTKSLLQSNNNNNNNKCLSLFDLSRYGPNLHHYAVECSSFQLQWRNGTLTEYNSKANNASNDRPVVVVLDTGLTGCILSKSLQDEWNDERLTTSFLQGLSVSLPTTTGGSPVTLRSSPKYWQVACFELPWFTTTDNKYYQTPPPHIIAIGATVWASGTVESLTIDLATRLARIDSCSPG